MAEVLGSGGPRTTWIEVWRATILNGLVEDITPYVVSGSIDTDTHALVKTTAYFELMDASKISPLSDYLAVFLNISYSDGTPAVREQLGLFVPTLPDGSLYGDENPTGRFECYDLGQVLLEDTFEEPYNVSAGTSLTAAMRTLLATTPCANAVIETSSKTFAEDNTAKPGDSKLKKLNEWADTIGFQHIWFSPNGVPQSSKTPSLSSMQPLYTFTGADIVSFDISTDQRQLANQVTVIKDNPGSDYLYQTVTNDDPDSRVSTVSMGRVKGKQIIITGDDVDQSVVNARAAYELEKAKSHETIVTIQVMPLPRFSVHNAIKISCPTLLPEYRGTFWVTSWGLSIPAESQPMHIECNKVLPDESSEGA